MLIKKKPIIAVIPARLGSKRIQKKNLKAFLGEPIISYVIKNALKSAIFDDVVVSTESLEVAEIAIQYGASVPYLRDSSLADDFTSSDNVVVDVIEYFERTGTPPEFIACIYPTSPCLEPGDLQASLEKMKLERAKFLMAARRIEFSIERTFVEGAQGKLYFADFKSFQRRSQDLPTRFLDAGQFYWGTCIGWKELLDNKEEPRSFFELPWHKSLDIDSPQDWDLVETIYKIYFDKNTF